MKRASLVCTVLLIILGWMQAVGVGQAARSGHRKDMAGTTFQVYDSLSAIASDSTGRNLVAASSFLYTSKDFGRHWSAGDAPEHFVAWVAVASSSTGQYLVATNSQGQIYRSADFGVHWMLSYQSQRMGSSWAGVAVDSTGRYMTYALTTIGGTFSGLMVVSADYGATWSETNADPTLSWRAVASDASGSNLIAGVHGGGIFYSTDRGQNWSKSDAPDRYWVAMTSDAVGQFLAAVAEPHSNKTHTFPTVYTSWDQGHTWTGSSITAEARAIASDSTGRNMTLVFYESAFAVQRSTDFGATFTPQTIEPYGDNDARCLSVASDSTGQCVTIGAAYLPLVTSADYGVSWEEYTLSCPDEYTVPMGFNECGNPCDWPFVPTMWEPYGYSYQCYHIALRASTPLLAFVCVLFCVLYAAVLGALYYQHPKLRNNAQLWGILTTNTAVPTLDALSDLLFIMSSTLANFTILFALVVVFGAHSAILMLKDMTGRQKEAYFLPGFWVMQLKGSWLWTWFDPYHQVLLMIAVLAVPCVLVCLFSIAWVVVMLVIVGVLYSTRLFAFTCCADTWFYFWSGLTVPPSEDIVNVTFFNEQTFLTAMLASLPQFAIQLLNMLMVHEVTNIAMFSLVMSFLNALNVTYKTMYYRVYLQVPMKEIPHDIALLNDLSSENTSKKQLDSKEDIAAVDAVCTPLLGKSVKSMYNIDDRLLRLEQEVFGDAPRQNGKSSAVRLLRLEKALLTKGTRTEGE